MDTKCFGILTCGAVALAATFISRLQHFMSAPIVGLLLCMAVMNVFSVGPEFLKGAKFAAKNVLNLAIVLVGGTLNVRQIMGTGGNALPMLVCNVVIALGVAAALGRKMKMTGNTTLLVGSGTAICGGTAIATAASVIQADEEEIAYAMAAIFFFDIIGALVFPYLAVGLELSNVQMGFLIGGAVNDMSSVTAGEATFNILTGQNLNTALTVKLARTTLLIPLAIVLSIVKARENSRKEKRTHSLWTTLHRAIPWVIIGFIGMAILNSAGAITRISLVLANNAAELENDLKVLSKFLTTVALCGVGFKIRFRDLITRGLKPVLLGGFTWLSITVFVFLYMRVLPAGIKF